MTMRGVTMKGFLRRRTDAKVMPQQEQVQEQEQEQEQEQAQDQEQAPAERLA